MRTKKVLVTTVAGAAALSLAACGSSGSEERGPATDACPDGVLTLSVLRAEASLPTDEQIQRYQQDNECVEFDVSEVPFGQLAEKISVTAASSNPPDVLGFDGPNTQSYASQGLLLPLDEYLPDGWTEDVLPATLDEHTWDGQVYSPGVQQDTLALFYNKDMTDAAGIQVPQTLDEAWTWPEARAAFEACQASQGGSGSVWGLAPSRLGDGTPGFAYRDLLFLRSAGDPEAPEDSSLYKTYYALSEDGTEVEGWLNTPEAAEAATFYQELFNGPNPVTPNTGIPNAMIDEKACFDIETTQLVSFLTEADVQFNWGVSPMPYFTTPIVHTGAVTPGVSSRTEHPAEAADFVMSIATGDALAEYAEANVRLPVLKSVAAEVPVLQEPPYTLFTEEVEQWGHPRPPSPQFTQYNQYVTDALRDIAYGSDPQQSLDEAAAAIQPLLGD